MQESSLPAFNEVHDQHHIKMCLLKLDSCSKVRKVTTTMVLKRKGEEDIPLVADIYTIDDEVVGQ